MPHIGIETLLCIAANQFEALDFSEDNIPTEIIQVLLHLLTSSKITPEEQVLGTFTRQKLKTCPTWNKWEAGERRQLDQFKDLEMFGSPTKRPKNPDSIVLRSHLAIPVQMR